MVKGFVLGAFIIGCCNAFVLTRPNQGSCIVRGAMDNASGDVIREKLAKVEAEYNAKQAIERREEAARSGQKVPGLATLALEAFVDAEGHVVPYVVPPGARASIFAVFNEQEELVYVGITRNAAESFRQILARKPQDAYFFRIHHLEKPARAVLQLMKEAWIEENGASPRGNRDEEAETEWDSATDVQLLMNEEERAYVDEQRKMDKLGPALRRVARVYEAEKVAALEARGIKGSCRFDPKLKLIGLLDLK